MRILYVSQYFPPEIGAPAARVHELSREWSKLGHAVTVLTGFPNHPTGRRYQGFDYRGGVLEEDRVDGVRVVRTYEYFAPNRGVLPRGLNYGSFMVSAFAAGLIKRLGRHDVLIATSPQILCGVAGWALARSLGLPFVLEVRDIWPEAIEAHGLFRAGVAYRLMKALVLGMYGDCDALVGVTESFRGRFLADGVLPDKIAVIPNGVDAELFRPLPRDNSWTKAVSLRDSRFRLGYVGNIGQSQGIGTLVHAADLLRGQDVDVVVVGTGAERSQVARMAGDLALPNFRLIEPQPRERMPEVYASFDAVLVPLRRFDLFRDFIPSKIFEIMACGRPIVAALEGEARELVVDRAGAGVPVVPDDAGSLAMGVRNLMADPALRGVLGDAGRRFVTANYLRSVMARRYIEVLHRARGRRSRNGDAS